MSKTKKILIAVSLLVLVFSLVSLARTFLRDYAEKQKIEELTKVWKEGSEQGGGDVFPPFCSIKAMSRLCFPNFEIFTRGTQTSSAG